MRQKSNTSVSFKIPLHQQKRIDKSIPYQLFHEQSSKSLALDNALNHELLLRN
jgi:hypothetical protein